jgi:hypothetical protein
MKGNLLEAYSKRLNIAESFYAGRHNGEKLSEQKKLVTAVCLNNVNKFLTEAFANSTGTQMSDMGQYKKFCMSLTNLAVPDLIVYDIMRVEPMTSMTGYITYLKITAGSKKGETEKGHVFNSPFYLGTPDKNYTSSAVVESFVGDGSNKVFTVAWTPLVSVGSVKVAGVEVPEGEIAVDAAAGTVTLTNAPAASAEVKIAYIYDNVYIPQNDLPIVNAELASIALSAKARRVAVYYSQMAAFQAKQDYGFDLGDTLATQAVGELNYEIDTEAVELLVANAGEDADLVWSKTQPFGVNLRDHYESFLNQIEIAKARIYTRTKKFAPNFMVIAADILPVLGLVSKFQAASTGKINGPYFAGSVNGLKVFVHPGMEAGHYIVGVNNNELQATAGVFAPYMPIVPTQLLGFADGAMSQGWSTLYDMVILNPLLLIQGRVTA